jgi:hypothetical protein
MPSAKSTSQEYSTSGCGRAVTSGGSCAAMNTSMTGSIVLVSALSPSNADTISGNPRHQ